jgi:hypothetical protein
MAAATAAATAVATSHDLTKAVSAKQFKFIKLRAGYFCRYYYPYYPLDYVLLLSTALRCLRVLWQYHSVGTTSIQLLQIPVALFTME